jgi:hypothetical protein
MAIKGNDFSDRRRLEMRPVSQKTTITQAQLRMRRERRLLQRTNREVELAERHAYGAPRP